MPFSIRPYYRLPLIYFSAFISLITFLVQSGSPAYAEWVEVTYSEEKGGYILYVDQDTIRRKGNLVKMWSLWDFKTVQRDDGNAVNPYLSMTQQREYDCAEDRTRSHVIQHRSGNMGTGNVVWTNTGEERWVPVFPGSTGQTLWKIACAKK